MYHIVYNSHKDSCNEMIYRISRYWYFAKPIKSIRPELLRTLDSMLTQYTAYILKKKILLTFPLK